MGHPGEHLLPGQIGHFMVILSFVAAAFAAFAYWRSFRQADETLSAAWRKFARRAVYTHVISTLVFVSLVLYLIVQHYFEYKYILEHSNRIMDLRYLLVCFWSGQEGSFMLWIFWHAVLALILLRTARKWEAPVMSVFMLVQFFLVSMLLGVYVGEFKIGSSPFALMREADANMGPLWALIPDYIHYDPLFADGRGLNPLLQNYWMTIHPPTLFLGFSLTLVPFCYAVAGLLKKDYSGWIKPALAWNFTGVAVLGIGILMGGAWAYESLSFGGFWAWDPVENASVVPWLTMVGSGHLMLLNRNKSKSVYSALFFTLITFILILYSTFLTRSGVLGDTSVHSFTGEDMLGQLLFCLMFFMVISFALLMPEKKERNRYLAAVLLLFVADIVSWNHLDYALITNADFQLTIRGLVTILFFTVTIIFLVRSYMLSFSSQSDEDEITSREFWMFIGALVLFMSMLHIIIVTSLPVGNMLFKTNTLISPDERNAFYNKWQTPFALVVCILMGFAQYLKYKKTPGRAVLKSQWIPVGLSLILTFVVRMSFPFESNPVILSLLLFAGLYAVISNVDYYVRILKGKTRSLGTAMAHTGFGLVMLGALISQAEQKTLSRNYKGFSIDLLDDDGGISSLKDVQLFRGDTTALGDYFVCYSNRKREKVNLYFTIDYFERENKIYRQGEKVRFGSGIFSCNRQHTASGSFISDMKYWKQEENPTPGEYFSTPVWENGQAGKKMFSLTPFIQMNPMQKVAEPGTKHYFSYDVFTHIKYAELTGPEDEWMDAIHMKGNPGDTLWTAGYKVAVSDPVVVDTAGYRIHQVNVTVFDHYDNKKRFGLSQRLHYAVDSLGNIYSPFTDFAEANLRMRIEKVPSGMTSHGAEPEKYEFTFLTHEYLILHAIRFPWISILWIGSLLMMFGTLWAVVVRIRKNKTHE